MSRATLKDVAAHAGVSHQTVSNVLNDHPSIRPAMRERVLYSIEALDYHPNMAAKALRESRITTLCCVFYNHHAEELEDPYRNLIQSAFIFETQARGYAMTTAFLDSTQPASFENLRRAYMQRQIAGAVIVGTYLNAREMGVLSQWGLPSVLFDNVISDLRLPTVTADYAGGMAAMVRRHIEQGRTRLTLVIPQHDQGSTAVERRRGFAEAMDTLGLEPQVVNSDWSFESGERAFLEVWKGGKKRKERPDAVLCGNDRMAAGALHAARLLGLRVPEDVAISGFDDFEFARYTAPSLTTAKVPYVAMAQQAVRTLLERLENPDSPVQTRSLPISLVIRESA